MSPAGANCLDLRRVFNMNLAGVQHEDGTISWFPGVQTCLRRGDRGLFIRVPPPGDGPWQAFMPSMTRDTWENIADQSKLRKMVHCEDDASWSKWMKAASGDHALAENTASAVESVGQEAPKEAPKEEVKLSVCAEQVLEVFQRSVDNYDGFMSKEELQVIFRKIGMDVTDLQGAFESASSNSDGKINTREFVRWVFDEPTAKK